MNKKCHSEKKRTIIYVTENEKIAYNLCLANAIFQIHNYENTHTKKISEYIIYLHTFFLVFIIVYLKMHYYIYILYIIYL